MFRAVCQNECFSCGAGHQNNLAVPEAHKTLKLYVSSLETLYTQLLYFSVNLAASPLLYTYADHIRTA